jgi:hypothetical protein
MLLIYLSLVRDLVGLFRGLIHGRQSTRPRSESATSGPNVLPLSYRAVGSDERHSPQLTEHPRLDPLKAQVVFPIPAGIEPTTRPRSCFESLLAVSASPIRPTFLVRPAFPTEAAKQAEQPQTTGLSDPPTILLNPQPKVLNIGLNRSLACDLTSVKATGSHCF